MKVGDYVRTNNGVGKISKYIYEPEYENCHVIWCDDDNYGIRYMDNEIKSAPNKIDLIKVGDYVNGHRVVEVDLYDIDDYGNDFKYIKTEHDFTLNHWIKENEIKSIVTKEQFEDMEYKVK